MSTHLKRLESAWFTLPEVEREHSLRTARQAVVIGSRLCLSADTLRTLWYGAVLHDVGKAFLSGLIWNKPASLTDEEERLMRLHPRLATLLMRPIQALRPSIAAVLHHHERWDGFGYPARLKGAQIPLLARIVAVAEVWDALQTHRPYRPRWSRTSALEHMQHKIGTHFDPVVVDALVCNSTLTATSMLRLTQAGVC